MSVFEISPALSIDCAAGTAVLADLPARLPHGTAEFAPVVDRLADLRATDPDAYSPLTLDESYDEVESGRDPSTDDADLSAVFEDLHIHTEFNGETKDESVRITRHGAEILSRQLGLDDDDDSISIWVEIAAFVNVRVSGN